VDWRTGLALLVALSITLLTSAAPLPRRDPPAVSVSFIESPALEAGIAPSAVETTHDGFRR
jgi:hypothetical protein